MNDQFGVGVNIQCFIKLVVKSEIVFSLSNSPAVTMSGLQYMVLDL